MTALDVMQAPVLRNPMVPPSRPAMPPLSKRPAAAAVVPTTLAQPIPAAPCQAWGSRSGVNGLVTHDASGVCLTLISGVAGNRLAVEAPMPPAVVLELIMSLVSQLGAWKAEFGRGGAL